MLLFTIIVGGTSTSISAALPIDNPVLKLAWRNITMFPYLLVAAIVEMFF